jgi:hypothetical protein
MSFDPFAASMTDREYEMIILARLADLEDEFFSTDVDLTRDEPSAADWDAMSRLASE